MLGVDRGEGDEGASVLRPAGEDGEALQSHLALHDLRDRPSVAPPRSHSPRIREHVPRSPDLARRGREQGLRQLGQAADEQVGPPAEGQLRACARAEEVGDEREVGAANAREQQRGPARGDDAAMDLGRLQARVHGRFDDGQVALPPQRAHEGAKVRERRLAHSQRLFPIGPAFTKGGHLRITCAPRA